MIGLFDTKSGTDLKGISDGVVNLDLLCHGSTVEINEKGGGSFIDGK
jgi:serine protease inhibitor